WLLVRGGMLPLAIWCLAAASDFFDGRMARRYGTSSPRGAVLDNVADVSFVLGGLATAAALGLVSWVTPASISLSVAPYVLASARSARAGAGFSLARSRLGHWAGVANYLCLGAVAAAVAWPSPRLIPMVGTVALATAGCNVAAVAARLIGLMSRHAA